jgi:excinuclease UvrABC nuclease subunit
MIINKKDINVKLKRFNGVYFVYIIRMNDNIIYIGSSKNIYKRFKEHKYQKVFDSIEIIKCNSFSQALIKERELIFKHNPEDNTFCIDQLRMPQVKEFRLGIDNLKDIHKNILNR